MSPLAVLARRTNLPRHPRTVTLPLLLPLTVERLNLGRLCLHLSGKDNSVNNVTHVTPINVIHVTGHIKTVIVVLPAIMLLVHHLGSDTIPLVTLRTDRGKTNLPLLGTHLPTLLHGNVLLLRHITILRLLRVDAWLMCLFHKETVAQI